MHWFKAAYDQEDFTRWSETPNEQMIIFADQWHCGTRGQIDQRVFNANVSMFSFVLVLDEDFSVMFEAQLTMARRDALFSTEENLHGYGNIGSGDGSSAHILSDEGHSPFARENSSHYEKRQFSRIIRRCHVDFRERAICSARHVNVCFASNVDYCWKFDKSTRTQTYACQHKRAPYEFDGRESIERSRSEKPVGILC